MIVYFCGAHGVGKTTMTKQLFINKGVIRLMNTDFSPELNSKASVSTQLRRHELFFNSVINSLKGNNELIIVDQCPESLIIYDKAHHARGLITDEELNLLIKDYEFRINELRKLITGMKEVYVYLRGSEGLIKGNILSRKRSESLNELDIDYLRMIINSYDDLFRSRDGLIINLNSVNDYLMVNNKVSDYIVA